MRRIRAALAAVAMLAAPAVAQTPAPVARDLAQKLARAHIALAESGFVRGAGPFAQLLLADEIGRVPLTLRVGEVYSIVAVCDARCSGVGLALRNEAGEVIARAEGGRAMAVQPAFTGAYEVQVAADCAGAECWYAVSVYSLQRREGRAR